MLGLFGQLTSSAGTSDRILFGPVILTPNGPLIPLKSGQHPWDIRPRVPGIHLQADLGLDVSLPPNSDGGMKLNRVLFQIYSPLSLFPADSEPEYDVAMAYAGDLFIPSIGPSENCNHECGEECAGQ